MAEKKPYFSLKKADDGRFYFNLHSDSPTEEIVATSQMYQSKQGAEGGIDSVKRCAAYAEVRDET